MLNGKVPFSSVGPQILMYKTMNLHLARPISKRAAASALVNAIGGTSNIWASYLYVFIFFIPLQAFPGPKTTHGWPRLSLALDPEA